MRIIILLLFLGIILSCRTEQRILDHFDTKVKGLTFTGPGRGPYDTTAFINMAGVNADFVALVPEATVYRQNLQVRYSFKRQWYGETRQAVFDGVDLARKNDLKVMLKPHLAVGWDMSGWEAPEVNFEDSVSRRQYAMSARQFISTQESKVEGNSSWRGDFAPRTKEDWQVFEQGYAAFILEYAKIADSLDVEMFCVGTELKRVALERPDFFRKLAQQVREIYDGPIVYAANWDSYNKISFWDAFDYIGVDAYFPLSDKQLPEKQEMLKSWEEIASELREISSKYKRGILLTEWGYEDEEYVGKEPWIMTKRKAVKNEALQTRAYESMFETIWNESWMKGVFVWRWEPHRYNKSLPDYSPDGKEAQRVLSHWFGKD